MNYFILLLMLTVSAVALADPKSGDTTRSVHKIKRSNLKLVTRLHSLGQFSYGGRLVADNPVIDVNFTYDRKTWGIQVFKAMDIKDRSTPINFMLAVVNRNFHFGKRLTVTPSAGFLLEQYSTIADHGSDMVVILTTSYKISKGVTIDHSSLFGNLILEPEAKDWVNRLRLMYSKNHLDITLLAWHNNKVFDHAEYITCGTSFFYSRFKISKSVALSAGVTALFMPYSGVPAENPVKNGIVFSLGATID